MTELKNLRVGSFQKLISPNEIRAHIPTTEKAAKSINQGRANLCDILEGKDDRFVVITGPCSIHNIESALEYAQKLNELRKKFDDKLYIIMRVYFEKPRTTVGWKGLINDPHLDQTYDVKTGLEMARKLLIDIAELGLPTATELLDPIIAAYIAELVSWVAIGARTTESQTHREMASGLSSPVGFKNNSDGNLDVAINAMLSAKSPHNFLGIDDEGNSCIVATKGNPSSHIVLRGGGGKPNYHMEDIENCEHKLEAKGFMPKIMVDCSHENSRKDHTRQCTVVKDIIAQKNAGNTSLFGIMLESNLCEGNQKIPEDLKDLAYGVSITDKCISFEETEKLLQNLYDNL